MGGLQTSRKPDFRGHNRQETPLFAKSIERHALGRSESLLDAAFKEIWLRFS